MVEIACDSTVARAAPFTPILKTKMNINVELLCDIRNGVKIWNIGKLKNNDIFDILNNSYIKKGGIKEGPVYSRTCTYNQGKK